MIISAKHKYIFFKSIKTAGSSIEKALHSTLDENDYCSGGWCLISNKLEYAGKNSEFLSTDDNGEEVLETRFHQHTSPYLFFSKIKYPEIYKSYRKIVVVRNPWDMVLSYYWYTTTLSPETWDSVGLLIKKSDTQFQARQKFMKWLLSESTYDTHASRIDFPEHEKHKSIDWMKKEMQGFVDDKYITDYMRYEKLDKHFKSFCNYIGKDIKLPHLKSNTVKSKEEHYSYFYNKNSEKVVEIAFQKTIEKFGYKFKRKFK